MTGSGGAHQIYNEGEKQDMRIELQEELDYFGGCPLCGSNNGYLNVGKAHWFHCKEHATRWCAGANLFSGWREESEEDWHNNVEELAGYAEVEPLMPSWCRPISKEEWDQEMREEGWIEESPGTWRNPKTMLVYKDALTRLQEHYTGFSEEEKEAADLVRTEDADEQMEATSSAENRATFREVGREYERATLEVLETVREDAGEATGGKGAA